MSNRKNHVSLEGGPAELFDTASSGARRNIELMTVGETAAFLKISRTGVRRLQHARQLPFVKVGGSVRFVRDDLVHYLSRRRVVSLDA